MTSPTVSVVVPTRDRPGLLAQALAGVLWQENVDLEVVIVDDGSVGDTGRSVPGVSDPRVRIVRNEHPVGVSGARNRGIAEAAGVWIAFLDDDDLWGPDKLAVQVEAATRAGTTWAYAGAVKIDGRNAIIGGRPPPSPDQVQRRLPTWNLVPGGCSGVIARRETVAEVGAFDEGLVNLADWDLWIRLGATGVPACASDPLVAYRFHGGQASLDVGLIVAEADALDRRYGAPIDRGALHHYLAYRSMIARRRLEAVRHLAVAAARGEARAVATDVGGIAGSRLARLVPSLGRLRQGASGSDVAWRARAAGWLRDLEELIEAPVPPEPPG